MTIAVRRRDGGFDTRALLLGHYRAGGAERAEVWLVDSPHTTKRHAFGEGFPHKFESQAPAIQYGLENNRTLACRQRFRPRESRNGQPALLRQ
jgi:hypothetical protein